MDVSPIRTSSDRTIAAAIAARQAAYAPYSEFRVGAAVRSESGAVYTGCNVENAAYPEGICAEAAAIAAMVMAGERRIAEIAVAGGGRVPVHPLRRMPAEDPGVRRRHHPGSGVRPRRASAALHAGRATAVVLRSGQPRLRDALLPVAHRGVKERHVQGAPRRRDSSITRKCSLPVRLRTRPGQLSTPEEVKHRSLPLTRTLLVVSDGRAVRGLRFGASGSMSCPRSAPVCMNRSRSSQEITTCTLTIGCMLRALIVFVKRQRAISQDTRFHIVFSR